MTERKKVVYGMRIPYPLIHFGLCNQLCLLLNSLEEAFHVSTLGEGVIYVPNILRATYGGVEITSLPEEGYHTIGNDLIGYDPLPERKKTLEIYFQNWTQRSYVAYQEGNAVHWIWNTPDEIHIYASYVRPHFTGGDIVPFNTVIDIDMMNTMLEKHNIKIIQKDERAGHCLDALYNANSPRNSNMFKILCRMLSFHTPLMDPNRPLIMSSNRKWTSIVHLRMEQDFIEHRSAHLKIPIDILTERLTKCYMHAIDKYIDPNLSSVIVLMSEVKDNPVVKWMLRTGYRVSATQKRDQQREIDAVYDMVLASRHCDHVFIGMCNHDWDMNSSFYSFILSCRMRESVRKVFINLNDILNS